MPYVSIDEFKGMDTRKPRVTGVPGTLFRLKNGHLTRGAHIQRSKKFVSKFTLPTSAGTTEAQATYRLDAGTTGSCTSIDVAGTELLGSGVAFNSTLTQTAADIATEINANTSAGLSHGYTATSTGQRITIIAPAGSGASDNGDAVTLTCGGDLVHTGDGFWDDTVLLMRLNGADGENDPTVVLDESVNGVGSAHLFVWSGNAQLDTAQKKFGTASLLLDGSGDAIFTPNSADFEFAAGAFTVEAWIRVSSTKEFQGIASSWSEHNNSRSWLFWYKGSNDKLVFSYSTDGVGVVELATAPLGLALDTFHHVAVSRDSSNNLRIYFNGVVVATAIAAATFFDAFSTTPLRIGAWQTAAVTGFFDGRIDDARITKGSARYIGDFAVPVATHDVANTTAGISMGGFLLGDGAGVTTTFGMHNQGDNLFVFGGFSEPAGVPSGVTYQRLAHKDNPNTTQILRVLDTENFDGKIYAIAEFTDGEIFHYYDGTRITDWDDISAAIASNNSVASALKTKIDLHPDFDATVSTNVATIEAAVAGVGFTIAATAQNFGTVNDQVITLAQTVANDAGGSEVLATGTVTVTGGLHDTASEGSVNLDSGGAGSVDGITVDGVEIMSGAEAFDTSLSTTATNVAANITANTSAPDYTATAVGALITITADHDAGGDPNGFVVVSSTTTISSTDVNMGTVTAGITNAITALSVDGVSIIDNRVDHEESNSLSAIDLATEIVATTSSPNYTAAAVGNVVTITAIAGTGAGPNGFVVALTVVGDFTAGTTNMQGGAASSSAAKEKWTATITGTFEAPDVFTITLNSEDFTVTGAGSATGKTAITFKKKMYVTASSLLYFSGINNPTVWAQVPNTEDASQIGAGFVNFANQDSGSEDLTATGIYQGSLGVFSEGVIQIEFVDVDEEANTLLHTVRGTGTNAHRSAVQFGNNDLFYLDDALGIRSLRARDSSNAPSADDVGTPVDDHVLAHLETVTEQQAVDAWGMIAEDGRYWLAIKNRIYVFSFFKNSKVSAWSFYEPEFNITAMAKVGKKIYVRDDASVIYLYGGDNGTTYPDAVDTPLEIEFPFMDVDKAAHQKTLEAFDFAAINEFDCNILVNPNDETVMSETFTLNDVTYPDNRVGGLSLRSSHFAPKLVCDKAGLAELHSLAVHYQLEDAA